MRLRRMPERTCVGKCDHARLTARHRIVKTGCDGPALAPPASAQLDLPPQARARASRALARERRPPLARPAPGHRARVRRARLEPGDAAAPVERHATEGQTRTQAARTALARPGPRSPTLDAVAPREGLTAPRAHPRVSG